MKLLVTAVAILVVASLQCEGKTFTRCELVLALRAQKFPESDMRDWVCLVEHESSRRTDVIGPPNRDGSRDHGLFQINDHIWCNDGDSPGKGCHVTCAQLRTDDITRASTCAKKIFQIQGFYGWYGWINYCKDKPLPDISNC